MGQITYANKVALNVNPEIAAINKVSDDDMNEIKQVVNDNYNNTIQITDTEPTDSDNKLWIDTGEIGSAVSEITNEYSTSIGLGYSANYANNLHTYSNDEVRIGTWLGKPLYRKVLTFPALKNNGETTLSYDSTFIIQKFDIYVGNPTNPVKFHLPIASNNYIGCYITTASPYYISVQTTSDRTAFTDNYVIIEYTKTTD